MANENPIETLRARLDATAQECTEIKDTADGEKRRLSKEEMDRLKELTAEFESLEAEIQTRETLEAQQAALNQSQGRKVPAEKPEGRSAPENGNDPKDPPERRRREPAQPADTRRWGFRSFGEFALSVRHACQQGVTSIDRRLEERAQPSTYGSEGVGADGGFAVPPDFRAEIMALVAGEDSLLSRTDQLVSSSNQITVPVDQATPWGTTGPRAYWVGENSQITESKPALEERTIRLHKLGSLVPVTDELLEDAPAIDRYLRAKVPQVLTQSINKAIVSGSGVGQPLGILNSPCLIQISKESSQIADSIIGLNVLKMWNRCYAPVRTRSVWLIHQDVEPELMRLSISGRKDSATPGTPVTGWGTHLYTPPGGLSASPYGTLFGRPVIATQACETVGDLGDIILADMGSYMTATKGGVRTDTSIHLYFDYDAVAFRFILRIAGEPWWSAAISPRDGSNTLSPFVALAERT